MRLFFFPTMRMLTSAAMDTAPEITTIIKMS